MENFALFVYTAVAFNMDGDTTTTTTNGLCEEVLLIAWNSLTISSADYSNQHALECFHNEERMKESVLTAKVEKDNVFWL